MSYTTKYLDDVRRQIAPDDVALKEAAARRDAVLGIAESFPGALGTFRSGSLAHRTANCPIHHRDAGLDADCGMVLDRRHWTALGPDSIWGEGPTETVGDLIAFIKPRLRDIYPSVELKPTKRAIFVAFNEPLPAGEDPTVDLVMALGRKDAPGLWIPNTESDTWDPSDPETHTRLLTAPPEKLRLARQHAIRLGKAENKRDGNPPLCSFNIEAFGQMFVKAGMSDAQALHAIWSEGAADLAWRLTPDPAGVSAPIKVEDRDYAIRRLRDAAGHLGAALDRDWDEAHVRSHLYQLWPEFVPAKLGQSTKADLVVTSRTPAKSVYFSTPGLNTTAAVGAAAVTTGVRSYGDGQDGRGGQG